MQQDKVLTEQESLRIITEMIQKAKQDFKETGISSLLWGSVIGFCGITSFLLKEFNIDPGFDIWLLTAIAIVPQIFISIKESKKRNAKRLEADSLASVWIVFAISVLLLTFYQNVVGYATADILKNLGVTWYEKKADGTIEQLKPNVLSGSSLYLLLYAMPTMITGLNKKFKPMIVGALITYLLFFISVYTPFKIDLLLQGISGIVCWLIPGIILYRRYKKAEAC
ncbi:MAG: hypothetical protein J0I09_09045 [Sphingobacteriia bacterium]|nr:hypothetical protein [Sphingobacteriia bacterium]